MEKNRIRKLVMDIGNSYIKLLVGEISDDFLKMEILDYVEVETKGIKKSVVESSEEVAKAISKGIKKLKAEYRDFEKVTVGVGGSYVQSKTKKVSLDFTEKKIEKNDIDALYKLAEKGLSHDDKILKKEMYNIRLHGIGLVSDPIGLEGDGLEANVHLIYVSQEDIEHFIDAISDLNLEIEYMYLNAYASLKATLIDESYTKSGVAVIDIGGGSTDIIIATKDKIIYSQSENIGGMHFVSDIMFLFHIGEEQAREVYEMYISGNMEEEYLSSHGKMFPRAQLDKIIDARIGDIASFILDTIEKSGFKGYLGEGIVITGGVANLERLETEIRSKTGSKTGLTVRRKKPFSVRGLEEPNYRMATVLGLFLETMRDEMLESKAKKEKEKEKIVWKITEEDKDYDEQEENLETKEEEKDETEKKTWVKKWLSYFI